MWGDVWGQPWAIWQPFTAAPEPSPVVTRSGSVAVGPYAATVRTASTAVAIAVGAAAHMVRVADASATVAIGAHDAKVVIGG